MNKNYYYNLIAAVFICSTTLVGCGQGSAPVSSGAAPFVTVGDAAQPTEEQELLFAQGYYTRRRAVRHPGATPTPTPVSTPVPTATPVATPRPTATPVSTPVATPWPTATPVATPWPTPVSTPKPTPVATPPPVIGCGSMNATSCEIFRLINEERVKAGIAPLGVNATCVASAQEQSQDMNDRNYFSHDRPAFPDRPAESFAQRMQRWGLGYSGENIAYGYPTPAETVAGWMNSAGHRANILNANFRNSGVGYYNIYATQCFTAY
jgi:uncharacterized protein YkwD